MWCLCVEIHEQPVIKEEEINAINSLDTMRLSNLSKEWEIGRVIKTEISNSWGRQHVTGAIIIEKSE